MVPVMDSWWCKKKVRPKKYSPKTCDYVNLLITFESESAAFMSISTMLYSANYIYINSPSSILNSPL